MNFLRVLLFLLCSLIVVSLSGQNVNGTIDDINDLFFRSSIDMPTPDGAKLATEVFLPITSDSLMVEFTIPFLGDISLELIQKGVQYIKYPELNGLENPNPFELPIIFTRTPYAKDDMEALGWVFAVLGYAAVLQDTRGINGSTDLFIPLYTDSWDKSVYTNFVPNSLLPDGYTQGGARNPSSFTDGLYTLDFLLNDLKRDYDIDEDGVTDFEGLVGNGSLLYFGASALSNAGLQMALSRKTDPNAPGLKGFLNIIASEQYWGNLMFNNGVYREGLLGGWVRSQVFSFDENSEVTDSTYTNNIHTPSDYGLETRQEVVDELIKLLSSQTIDGKAGVYPNSSFRKMYDASRAPVDADGNGDPFGAYSRFSNLDMPFYNISGWWDVFATGQIETWQQTLAHISEEGGNRQRQKLVIGPWQHFYPALRNAGDLKFPTNVGEVLGATADYGGDLDLDELDIETILSILQLDLEEFLNSELFAFIRYGGNYNSYKPIGEPNIRFPPNLRYQPFFGDFLIQIPSEEFSVTHADLMNWITGLGGLNDFRARVYEVRGTDTVQVNALDVDVPPLPPLLTDVFGDIETPLEAFPAQIDFEELPNVRLYVCGPINDGIPGNEQVGNYWIASDTFPVVNGLQWNNLYLHTDSSLSAMAPVEEEEAQAYVHDPHNPVITIGGNNLEIKTPNHEQAQGPKNLARPEFVHYAIDHPGVISFETPPLEDSLTLIGYPVMTLYASSMPEGASVGDPTDTDFNIRVVDVYSDTAQYQITEGVISARAREYARSIVANAEDDDAPFSNIESGTIYEYTFRMMPMGYTFGKGHRLKILVSSSNHPRYQSNPNIPVEDNEFFAWITGDSTASYTFEGTEYFPRKAVNSIHFSPEHPSKIILPVFGREIAPCSAAAELNVSGITDSTADLSWSGVTGADIFTIRYRELDSDEWMVYGPVQDISHFLDSLSSGTLYEWQVGSRCEDGIVYSITDTFESTGIPTLIDEQLLNALTVYPNPVKDVLHISISGEMWKGSVILTEMTGKEVYLWSTIELRSTLSLDVRAFESGAYMLEFRGHNGRRAAIPIVLTD
ncbi:MAG: CocE/NonD family hydrolase [Bacteroidetes bacterium]|nr:CocE/NonD family hydrolase [Bacteroidota bacterium]